MGYPGFTGPGYPNPSLASDGSGMVARRMLG